MLKLRMYTSGTCPACDLSKKMLEGFDIEIINVDSMQGKDLGLASMPTFRQGNLELTGFANKEILEKHGFVLTPKSA